MEVKMAKDGETSGTATPYVIPGTGIVGVGSASAQYERQQRGEEVIPEGEDRGSKLDAGQGDAVADGSGNETAAPVGLQAEPAQFTNTGSVVGNMVASPTGPVPVSVVAGSPEEAREILERRAEQIEQEKESRNSNRRYTEDEINMMDGGEVRALASQRGYDVGLAGTRRARSEFLRLQDADDRFAETKGRRRKAADAE